MDWLRAVRGTAGRAIALAAAMRLAALLAGFGVAPAAADGLATADLGQSPAEVREYWTKERLRAAKPPRTRVGGEVVPRVPAAPVQRRASRAAVDTSDTPTAFPDRVHGKVFFTITGGSQPGDYLCSATVVRANSHSLAWTAGHCVNDAEFGGGFASNWAFIPGYRAGRRPFGTWVARSLFTTEGWRKREDIRHDLGAAELQRDEQGRGIEDVIGARGIGFDAPRRQQWSAFGYPAVASLFASGFDGERSYRCDSPTTGSDNPPGNGPETIEIRCEMTGGASGGAWVTAAGEVSSVTSYGYVTDPLHLFGPYMGATARSLYADAAGPALLCARAAVTNLGDGQPNRFAGGPGDEIFGLGGAADRSAGQAGADRACGGGGGDRLRGGIGDDRLRGGPGRDRLLGGPGFDRCHGGPGRDRARGCEKRVRIP